VFVWAVIFGLRIPLRFQHEVLPGGLRRQAPVIFIGHCSRS
jgi:hypothetical protein